jgi:hypothetical protein
MSNKLKELREQVKKEIEHIPKGNLPQNELRMYYWPLRMNSLGKKAKKSETKEDVLKRSIESVQKEYPDFIPQFDKNFFKLIYRSQA